MASLPPPRARLLVFSPLYPPHHGGLESHAEQFNQALAERGYMILVLTPQLPATAPARDQQGSIAVRRFPSWELIPNYPLPRWWAARWWQDMAAAWRFSPDIVISRTRFFHTSLLAAAYAYLKGKPWLHVEHGSDFVYLSSPPLRQLARWYDLTVGRWVLHRATAVVANSAASAAFVTRLAPHRKPIILYRGIDRAALHAVPAAPARDTQPIIFYCGRLIAGKGVQDLLTAAARLKTTTYQLWIVGDGPAGESLRALAARLGIAARTKFWGDRPWAETMGLLKAADIVVSPSYNEGLPTAVIEAAFCSKAIVTTPVGGTVEIVSDTSALFFSPGNVAELTERLSTLLASPAASHRLGQAAQAKVATRFSWDTTAAHYDQLLTRLGQKQYTP